MPDPAAPARAVRPRLWGALVEKERERGQDEPVDVLLGVGGESDLKDRGDSCEETLG